MQNRSPVQGKRDDDDRHNQAKAQIELAANAFVHAHVFRTFQPAAQAARVLLSRCCFSATPACRLQTRSFPGREMKARK
jgi:hypothetical protein